MKLTPNQAAALGIPEAKKRAARKRQPHKSQKIFQPPWLHPIRALAESLGVNGLTQEHQFHKSRKWRFDVAWPEIKVAFEYEGVFSDKSRHTTATGLSNDCEKYNQAQIDGWLVIRATAITIRTGKAYRDLEQAIKARLSQNCQQGP